MAKEKKKKEYSTEWVKIDFTEDQIKEMAHSMAGDIQAIQDLEDQLIKVKSSLQSEIKGLNLSIKDLSQKVRDGFEYRNAKVRVLKDYSDKVIRFFLEDSDGRMELQPVKTRPMTHNELQMNIDDVVTGGGE